MIRLNTEISQYVLNNCPARTDEALNLRFGISYNTLRKIESGSPIRPSVAARLEQRVQTELSPE